MDLGLSGKVAVVTGGSVGIGLGVARAFAREGALVAHRRPRPRPRRGRRGADHRGLRPAASSPTPATSRPPTGCASLVEADAQRLRRLRHPRQQRRHRLERDHPRRRRRQVAGLLEPPRHGRRPPRPRPRADDGRARRRRDPQQRLDLRHAAALVRADLQRHQGGAADAVEEHGERVHPAERPGQHRQPRPDPHPRLGQDREAALRRPRGRLGGDWEGYLQSVADEHAPIKRFGTVEELADFMVFLCSDRARPTPSAAPTSSTAACSAPSEEAPRWPPRSPLATLDKLPAGVARPTYARGDLSPGILHFGVGNFHRAHLQVYLDRLMNAGRDRDWAIVGAGVTPYDVKMRDALAGQDRLSTVVEQSAATSSARVTGVMTDFLPPMDGKAIVAALADPAIRIVSLTVTEGGYFVNPATGKFDPENPAIAADAAQPRRPEDRLRPDPRRPQGPPRRRRRSPSPSCPATTSPTTAASAATPSPASPRPRTPPSPPGSATPSPSPTPWSTASPRRPPTASARSPATTSASTTPGRCSARTSSSGSSRTTSPPAAPPSRRSAPSSSPTSPPTR